MPDGLTDSVLTPAVTARDRSESTGWRVSFNLRVLGFAAVLMAVAVGISSAIGYRLKKQSLEVHLGRELLGIVKSVGPLIEGDLHDQVRLGPSGELEGAAAFQQLQELLRRVKAGNEMVSRGSPLYTLRRPDDFVISGELEFVVMTDHDDSNQFFTGARYHAEPHLLRALDGIATATGVYVDSEGVWISAAAPIRNADGVVVGVVQADRPVDFFYAEARNQAVRIVLGALSSLAVGAVLAWVFARSLTEPVRQLARATDALAAGQWTHRVTAVRSDELGDLARSFNAMAERLMNAHEREENHRRALEHANAMKEAVNLRLAATNLELEEAVEEAHRLEEEARAGEMAKSEFLATMSHELRTPLNGVSGFAQLLESTELSAEQADYVKAIQSSGQRLLETISAILEYSQLDRGRRPQQWKNIALRPDLTSWMAPFRLAATAKGLGFEADLPDDLPSSLLIDASALQRSLEILLSNAVKFTASGRVRVRLTMDRQEIPGLGSNDLRARAWERHLCVAVEDTGPGIPVEAQGFLFMPFRQVDTTSSRAHEGVGLGLAIAFKLVRSVGGDLRLETSSAKGSCFTLMFPVR